MYHSTRHIMLVSCLTDGAKLSHLFKTVSLRFFAWNLLPLPHSISYCPYTLEEYLPTAQTLYSFALSYNTCNIVLPIALSTVNLLLKFRIFLFSFLILISMFIDRLFVFSLCSYNLIFSLVFKFLLCSTLSFVFSIRI